MTEVTVQTRRHEPTAMFLRQTLATGTSDDGSQVELAISGTMLVLSVQPEGGSFGAGRVVESVPLRALIEAWVAAVEAKERGR
jgi:hypothetical protein